MPSGVYPRTPEGLRNVRKAAKKNFAKGHKPEARKKALASIKKVWDDEEKRKKVSERNKKRMHDPDVREKHLIALRRAIKRYGPNFKGGNGQEPVPIILVLARELEPKGYIREYPIKTKGHKTSHKAATCYKVDFGNPKTKHAIEVDGPTHRAFAQQAIDKKKQEILESLGWTVERIVHR